MKQLHMFVLLVAFARVGFRFFKSFQIFTYISHSLEHVSAHIMMNKIAVSNSSQRGWTFSSVFYKHLERIFI